jgi:hypothetical protein
MARALSVTINAAVASAIELDVQPPASRLLRSYSAEHPRKQLPVDYLSSLRMNTHGIAKPEGKGTLPRAVSTKP